MATRDDLRRIALSLPEATEDPRGFRFLIDMDPAVFFAEPHYSDYPAVLVRLPEVDLDLLQVVLRDAWRRRSPKRLLADALPSVRG